MKNTIDENIKNIIEKKLVVLFVDKSQMLINEIFLMLHNTQDEWETKFAYSGNEALEIIRKTKIDIVISDIDLPEMDGIHLLAEIKRSHPKTICVLMSENNYDKQNKAIDYFLRKPLSLDKLKKIILNPVDFLDKNKIRLFILKMDKMPTIPSLYLKLQDIMKSEDFSFNEIAKIIENDVTMTAKILQYVNSAYFGLRYRIYDILHAVTYLGLETLKSIILTLNVFCEFTDEEMEKFSIQNLYNHSLRVSCLVSSIIQITATEDRSAEESIVAGMLHDIGKLIFIKNKPEIYTEIFQINKDKGTPLHTLENQYFGVNHAEVGSFLTEIWGFSPNLIDAINKHHNPHNALKPPLNINSAVYIANILDHDSDSREITDEYEKIQNYLDKINQMQNLSVWCSLIDNLKKNSGISLN
ncbi:HDOD domain-containing protein [Candidatus Desantisbacteria bacterium]|nr:HDOD domain-containing protein [Candidatus Desantisbacteria bacterium]